VSAKKEEEELVNDIYQLEYIYILNARTKKKKRENSEDKNGYICLYVF